MAGAVVLSLVALALVSYKLLIVYLRRRRLAYMASLDPVQDALFLASIFATVEFPYLVGKGLGFALFRTYGVPAVSKLLQRTGGFQAGAVKRMEDTDVLAREVVSHHPDAPRGSFALRRMNYIHSHYKISNDEYLYTLSLFVTTPIDWVQRYGFRKPTEAEKTAQFVVWHDIGVRMGIRDIPGSYQELKELQLRHEESEMVYADSNRVVADMTLGVILGRAPAAMRPLARRAVYALLDDRLRKSMGFPEQPRWAQRLAHWAQGFVGGTCVGWLLPPRPISWAASRIYTDATELTSTSFDPYEVRTLKVQNDSPPVYANGYRISHLGVAKPGHVGHAFPGDLLCPLSTLLQGKAAVASTAATAQQRVKVHEF